MRLLGYALPSTDGSPEIRNAPLGSFRDAGSGAGWEMARKVAQQVARSGNRKPNINQPGRLKSYQIRGLLPGSYGASV